ncbi:MAG TPA: hypothetical protein VFE07_10025 [Marmoricola sp.]|nr:hypothetical protein [Marmoricola sp.]
MSQDLELRADSGRAPVLADLVFWTVAGTVVIALSGSLDSTWGTDRAALVVVAGVLVVGGLAALAALWRTRPMPRRLVRVFGVANLGIAPVVLVAALIDLLDLTGSGNAALAGVAVVTVVLGAWQLAGARR